MTYSRHQSLVNEYQKYSQKVLKIRRNSLAFLGGIWVILFFLKGSSVPNISLLTLESFSTFIIWRLSNFKSRRDLDYRMSNMLLEGYELEKQSPRLEAYFHIQLQQFGAIRIPLLRAAPDFAGLFCFLNALNDFSYNYGFKLTFHVPDNIFYIVIGIIGFCIGDIYYKPFKTIVAAKRKFTVD